MLSFQVASWHSCDLAESGRFVIRAFGRTEDGRSVALNVLDFTPFFFVKIPEHLLSHGIPTISRALQEFVSDALRLRFHKGKESDLLDVSIKRKRDYWGFHGDDLSHFARFTFSTQAAFRFASNLFSERVHVPRLTSSPAEFTLYESNVEPLLRWMHVRNVEAAGWIRVAQSDLLQPRSEAERTTCSIERDVDWRNVHPDTTTIKAAPFLIASFDIECDSSHGDFPQAVKTYHRTARELCEWYRVDSPSWKSESDMRAWRDGPLKDALARMFASDTSTPHLSRVFPLSPVTEKEARDRLTPAFMMDLMAYLDTSKGVVFARDETAPCSREQRIAELLGGSVNDDGDRDGKGALPPLRGDAVIQIGTTLHKYGMRECHERVVFVLGSCKPIEGVDVRSFDDERSLLLAWQKYVVEVDPDVFTGFNVFGFDWSYLVHRAKELGIDERFRHLGRVRDQPCKYVVKVSSSAAYGENVLKYVDTIGRVNMDLFKVVQREHKLDSYKLDAVAFHFTGERKDDVSPSDIFRLQKGSAEDRGVIAKYCVQDCQLVNRLVIKLDVVSNAIGMANVCSVPMAYIFLRGQGVKIFSLVVKVCRTEGFVVKTVRPAKNKVGVLHEEDQEASEWYEGAMVLEPKTGIYLDDPVAVLDYASLYPSSMIAENLSHDTMVMDERRYGNLAGVEYVTIRFDDFDSDRKRTGTQTVVKFAQNRQGILPKILQQLLAQRKATRKRMAGLADGDFQKSVLDGLQLAYKVTANSLYGQCGATTSPIFLREVAACTTATGRSMLQKAKAYMEAEYKAHTVYGDTDSLLCVLPTGRTGKDALMPTIRMAKEAAAAFNATLKRPHELEYEKTYWPFVLFAKKRYCAHKYENDDQRYKLNSMGIVLKRRDNAPIVKHVFGGCLDIILQEQDVVRSIEFLKDSLQRLIEGEFPLEDLVITKALRGHYADPTRIAHKVLADRMAARDPGNKPQVNDRIPFVYIRVPDKKVLQGERIEHPDFVRASGGKIKPDYEFYVSNQIMKPLLQLYALALQWMPDYEDRLSLEDPVVWKTLYDQYDGDETKMRDRLTAMRESEAKRLLFDPIFRKLDCEAAKNRLITDFFTANPVKQKKDKKEKEGGGSSSSKDTSAIVALKTKRMTAAKSRVSIKNK